jgi:hypothetical protein
VIRAVHTEHNFSTKGFRLALCGTFEIFGAFRGEVEEEPPETNQRLPGAAVHACAVAFQNPEDKEIEGPMISGAVNKVRLHCGCVRQCGFKERERSLD